MLCIGMMTMEGSPDAEFTQTLSTALLYILACIIVTTVTAPITSIILKSLRRRALERVRRELLALHHVVNEIVEKQGVEAARTVLQSTSETHYSLFVRAWATRRKLLLKKEEDSISHSNGDEEDEENKLD